MGGLKKLSDSSVFAFCAVVLGGSAVAAFNGQLSWEAWLTEAVVLVGIYASKEGIRYGASAYENKAA